jgi:hypothetical protein
MSNYFSEREGRTVLPAKLTISSPSSSDHDEPFVALQLTDTRSGARFAEVRVSYADFMAALMGRSHMAVECAVAGLALVGMQAEHKTELVHITDIERCDYDGRYAAAITAAAPFEVDGWRYSGPRTKAGSWSQGQWGYHAEGGYSVRLPFVRHVPYVEPGDDASADRPATEPDQPDGVPQTHPAVRRRSRKPDAA